MDTPMTLPQGKWTWVESEPEDGEEVDEVNAFKTVEDW